MSNHITKQCVLFKGLTKKALLARFDQEQASSDGGAVLLQAPRIGAAMAACLRDDRQQSKVWAKPDASHSLQGDCDRALARRCGFCHPATPRRKRKVKRITIDLDPTEDATHGSHQG